jgi:hypothetical protein
LSEKVRSHFREVVVRSEKALQLAETDSFKTVSISPGGIIRTTEVSSRLAHQEEALMCKVQR